MEKAASCSPATLSLPKSRIMFCLPLNIQKSPSSSLGCLPILCFFKSKCIMSSLYLKMFPVPDPNSSHGSQALLAQLSWVQTHPGWALLILSLNVLCPLLKNDVFFHWSISSGVSSIWEPLLTFPARVTLLPCILCPLPTCNTLQVAPFNTIPDYPLSFFSPSKSLKQYCSQIDPTKVCHEVWDGRF